MKKGSKIKENFTKQGKATIFGDDGDTHFLLDRSLMCQRDIRNLKYREYNAYHLAHDMGYFFSYLPMGEIRRFVKTFIWLIKEALRQHGSVKINTLGKFHLFDQEISDRTYQDLIDYSHGMSFKDYAEFGPKVARIIGFKPNKYARALVNPKTERYMYKPGTPFRSKTKLPLNRATYLGYIKRICFTHYAEGMYLLEKAFDKSFKYIGYTDDYYEAIEKGALRVENTKFGRKKGLTTKEVLQNYN